MGYDDFCRLTMDEFAAVCAAYADRRDEADRQEWERTRMLAAITIQPHLKKRITPESLIPFPWDKPRKPKNHAPRISAEAQKRRFEELVEREKLTKKNEG